jgi:hypothetical protein
MADKKVSELSAITNISGDDLLLVVNDPSGTPTSNKVTVSNLFANVVPNVVHKGTVTARANTTFSGTSMTVSANATYSGTLTVTGTLVESGTTTRSGVFVNTGNTIINGTLTANGNLRLDGSVSSGATNIIGSNGKINANNAINNGSIAVSMLQETPISNTTARTLFDDRMQVANVNLLVNDRLQVSNANIYLEVSNATAQFANSVDTVLTGITVAETISASQSVVSNTITVSSNTGLTLSGKNGDPSSNNTTSEGLQQGTIFYSNTYLYICVDANNIKRIPLEIFS